MVTEEIADATAAWGAKGRRYFRRSGFTLIELIVVVAIISILMGLVVTSVGRIRQSAHVAATKALMEGVSSGLNRFYTEFGAYPPSTVDELGDASETDKYSLCKYLCTTDRSVVEKLLNIKPTGRSMERFLDPPPEYVIKEADTPDQWILVDAWGTPLVYVNCLQYTEGKKADPTSTYTGDDKCHNPTSFDLYSCGPDKQKDPDPLEPVDDITNWAAKKQ